MKVKINPENYTKEYYLSDDYSGIGEYKAGCKQLSFVINYIYKDIQKATKGSKFLDAGCGKGELMYFMAQKNYDVYGV
ncbi:MAG: hypothetical protein AB1472_07705, partial [Candidatus Omnitrophota bacterium]